MTMLSLVQAKPRPESTQVSSGQPSTGPAAFPIWPANQYFDDGRAFGGTLGRDQPRVQDHGPRVGQVRLSTILFGHYFLKQDLSTFCSALAQGFAKSLA